MYIRNVSALEKVLPTSSISAPEYNEGSCLKNEEFSYQVAFIGERDRFMQRMKVDIISDISDCIQVYQVGNVPVTMPTYLNDCDNDYITHDVSVIPDILSEYDGYICASRHHYKALWLSVKTTPETSAGEHEIKLLFSLNGEPQGESVFKLNVIGAELPEQKLKFTQWFHCDSIATYYHQKPLSDAHWNSIDQFMKMASDHGINMILTPVVTPPLDTAVGWERPTVQLVDIACEGGIYSFSFEKLDRWLALCRKNHITHLEISHLFTQWGAEHCPKIEVLEDGILTKKFGWHTDSLGDEYRQFLSQFLPALTAHLKKNWDSQKIYFHISDEPSEKHLERYGKLYQMIKPYLQGFMTMDALSNIDFYKSGCVDVPVVATDEVEAFLEEKIDNMWVYYCCGQFRHYLSNRFIAMPSYRNRIIGTQLYKYKIKGFLQWGYNFYYSQNSLRPINPFYENDADGAFPAGDAFSVYPGPDGPLPSLRLKVFAQALQDVRAMELLESLIGRDRVMELVDAQRTITFRDYPRSADYILGLREQVNAWIAENL